MKVTELMIDDWVKLNDSNYRVQVIKKKGVIKLYENTKYGEHEIELNTNWIEEFIEPIPLTPEILEKNGFTIQNELYHSGNIWISEDRQVIIDDSEEYINTLGKYYSVHIDNTCMDSVLRCEVTYVHELQHAFRLAGYNKELIV